MRELRGRPVADAIAADCSHRIAKLAAAGITPMIAIVRMGERADDLAYERSIRTAATALGIGVEIYALPEAASQVRLDSVLERVNSDDRIHGCLIFRPLPAHIDEAIVCNGLLPSKDIDGVSAESLAGVFMGTEEGFAPATAEGCVRLLDHYGIDIVGRRITVVGRSLVIGKPVGMLLLDRDATVTYCHSRTADLKGILREAEIVICAVGRARMFDDSFFNADQVVLDVGMNVDEDGRLCGDVDEEAVADAVRALTPVPGGLGAVTTAVLLEHAVRAAERRADGMER